jgi:hypothetical protein
MTKPMQRPGSATGWEPNFPALLTESDALNYGRRKMKCSTCEWAVRKGDECEETKFVRGCIHWKARGDSK